MGLSAALVAFGVVLPHLAGTGWRELWATLGSLPASALAGLGLTGSAVADLLPMGGAAGVAANYRMTRSWGYDQPFATYTVITNLWDVAARVALPVVALVWLIATGTQGATAGPVFDVTALMAVGGLLSLLLGASLAAPRTGNAMARLTDRGLAGAAVWLPTRLRPAKGVGLARRLALLRDDVAGTVRRQ